MMYMLCYVVLTMLGWQQLRSGADVGMSVGALTSARALNCLRRFPKVSVLKWIMVNTEFSRSSLCWLHLKFNYPFSSLFFFNLKKYYFSSYSFSRRTGSRTVGCSYLVCLCVLFIEHTGKHSTVYVQIKCDWDVFMYVYITELCIFQSAQPYEHETSRYTVVIV